MPTPPSYSQGFLTTGSQLHRQHRTYQTHHQTLSPNAPGCTTPTLDRRRNVNHLGPTAGYTPRLEPGPGHTLIPLQSCRPPRAAPLADDTPSMTTRLSQPEGDLGQGRHFLSKHRCPEADYLAVYDSDPCPSSSHTSAQPSPDLSNDGTASAWSEEDLSLHLPPCALRGLTNSPPSTTTPTTATCCCSDTGSFECVDVALEHQGGWGDEEKGKKTVPKRQIQLRRRDVWDPEKQEEEERDEEAEASRPPRQRRDMFLRQHSTPATFHQQSHDLPTSHDLYLSQAERRQHLQKSLSLDETVSPCKTKIASCIIKNVLSKKMQIELTLQNNEVQETAFAPAEACNNTKNSLYHSSLPHNVSTADKNYTTQHSMFEKNHNTQRALGQSVVQQQSVSSKIQKKPLFKQNCVSALASNLARCEYQKTERRRSEIAGSSAGKGEGETDGEREGNREGTEGLGLQEGGQTWVNLNPRDRLSCDSAKNIHVSQGVQKEGGQDNGVRGSGKEEEEECQRGLQGPSKQRPLSPPAVQPGGDADWSSRDSQQRGALEWREGGSVARAGTGTFPGDLRIVAQSGSGLGPAGVFKGMAPVHVVRDVRSLVKNTYNLSFRNAPVDAGIGREDCSPLSTSQSSSRDILGIRKVSPPVTRTQITEPTSHYRGYINRTPLNQSHDRIASSGYTNVTFQVLPTSAGEGNSQSGSQPITGQEQDSLLGDLPIQPPRTVEAPALQQSGIVKTAPESNKQRSTPQCSALPAYLYTAGHHHQPESVPGSTSASQGQGLELPPSTQSQSTILSFPSPSTPGCVPQPFLSTYFYTPSPLAYQALHTSTPLGFTTLQTHLGKVSYIQAPILVQSPQTTGSGNSEKIGTKMVVLESQKQRPQQQNFLSSVQVQGFPPAHTESQGQGGGFSEMAPTPYVYGALPRHMQLDPESGRCFHVDTPPQPQRKMLFDPETCRYVEVYLPQQTMAPAAVTAATVHMPYPSFHFPAAMFAPQCLPLTVQCQTQEFPHNAP